MNAGVEASAQMGATRLYGQAGYTKAVSTDAANNGENEIYAAGELAYFVDPNLALSGNIMVGRWHGDGDDYNETDAYLGAEIEKKFDNSPLSIYAEYQFLYWNGATSTGTPYSTTGISNGILVGARVAFGDADGTLEDRETTAGLQDLNLVYGATPH